MELVSLEGMTEAVMCYDRSWSNAQDQKAKADERKPAMKDKRSETVDALLRQSNEQAQTAAPERMPAKEAAPAK
jgi:hypothetical protein